jgi:ribosome-associated translation inhibitor RaiA
VSASVDALRAARAGREDDQTQQENPVKIQVNTGAHIDGNEALASQVSAKVELALDRFSERITRVEVHLSDENGEKSGQLGQRCMLEARLEGRQPVAVTDHAATMEQAVQGAAEKLARLLDSTLGRLRDHR